METPELMQQALLFLRAERDRGTPAVTVMESLMAVGWPYKTIRKLLVTLCKESRRGNKRRSVRGCSESVSGTASTVESRNATIRYCFGNGLDLVQVEDDSGPDRCDACQRYACKVLSLSGLAYPYPEVPDFAGGLAEAEAAGLFNRGCTHMLQVWVSRSLATPIWQVWGTWEAVAEGLGEEIRWSDERVRRA